MGLFEVGVRGQVLHAVEGFGESLEHSAVDAEPVGSGGACQLGLWVVFGGVTEVGEELLHEGQESGEEGDATGAAAGAGVDELEGVVGGDEEVVGGGVRPGDVSGGEAGEELAELLGEGASVLPVVGGALALPPRGEGGAEVGVDQGVFAGGGGVVVDGLSCGEVEFGEPGLPEGFALGGVAAERSA